MKMITFISAAIFLGLFLLIDSSYAGYMKCGGHLISDTGSHRPTKYEVLKKCGEPTERYGDHWVYDRPGYQPQTLRFAGNGRLQHIQEQ